MEIQPRSIDKIKCSCGDWANIVISYGGGERYYSVYCKSCKASSREDTQYGMLAHYTEEKAIESFMRKIKSNNNDR